MIVKSVYSLESVEDFARWRFANAAEVGEISNLLTASDRLDEGVFHLQAVHSLKSRMELFLSEVMCYEVRVLGKQWPNEEHEGEA